MLPRVALEYGQTSCAFLSSASVFSLSCPSIVPSNTTPILKPLSSGSLYKLTVAVTVLFASIPAFPRTNSNALLKQAPYPAANSCSGFVPPPPSPPSSVGAEISK
ncbi:organic hydroperoxide resistance protein-like 2 [Listeria monocytogenes]|nr:organic hydroperoxide resistance protein-like 2 [Listeria monocytogenes]